jgi:regulator of PEP synthase PpsR (kinase-PPPase family)
MSTPYTIFIVSGGVGASGEQLVHTVLAQFPESRPRVITVPNVRLESQVEEVVSQATAAGGLLVHTLVDNHLRLHLEELAAAQSLPAIDLMGPLIEHLAQALNQPPRGQPGLYRKLNQTYFDRVSAIEFGMAHDDGQRSEDWPEAEIILMGVSRVGKTPLSLYLSVLGWKVANIPLVPGVEPHPQLRRLDRQRVFGLTIEPAQLLAFRQQRQQRLGVSGLSDYTPTKSSPNSIRSRLFTLLATVIDVTDRPIESSADRSSAVQNRKLV